MKLSWTSVRYRFCLGLGITLTLILVAIIPVRLAIAARLTLHPQAILTLGGGQTREEFTAQFAQIHPSLEIWVSSGLSEDKAHKVFRAAGISDQRVHLDYRAADTVTNFTTLVSDFQQLQFHCLYLITSDFHMRRAMAIAVLVLGSRGLRSCLSQFPPPALTNLPL